MTDDNSSNNSSINPYAAPTAAVLTAQADTDGATLIPGGRGVSAGRGIEWISKGWKLFTLSPLIWIVNVVIFIVLVMIINIVPLIGPLIGYFLFPVLVGGLMLGAHAQHGGRPLEVSDLFSGFSTNTGSLLVLGALYIACVIALVIVLGILAIVFLGASGLMGALMSGDSDAMAGVFAGAAGIGIALVILIALALSVPLAMAFWFAPGLVAINGLQPLAAISSSFKGCLKNMLPFLLWGIIFLVLFIIGTIPIFLGLLIVVPLMYASNYAAYRDIYLGDDE